MDCLEGIRLLPDQSIDLIVTDPPFLFETGGAGFLNDRPVFKKIKDSFGSNFNPGPFLKEISRVMKKMNMFIFCNKALVKNYLDFAIRNKYQYDILVWHKPNPIPTKNNHHLPDVEYIIYIREKGSCFNNDLPFSYYKKVQSFKSPLNINHPTPKPIELIRRLIKLGSKENDIVLDAYIGSGTTGLACIHTNRNFIGFEINPNFLKLANNRLLQKTLKQVTLK